MRGRYEAVSLASQAFLARTGGFCLFSCCATLQHMKTEHPFYGFTSERHSVVDAQLVRMQNELTAILAEYRRITAPTNLHGYAPLTMESALSSLRTVRLALQEEQDGLHKLP